MKSFILMETLLKFLFLITFRKKAEELEIAYFYCQKTIVFVSARTITSEL